MQHSENGAYEYIDSAELPGVIHNRPNSQQDIVYNELEAYETVEYFAAVEQPDTAHSVSSTTNDQRLLSNR